MCYSFIQSKLYFSLCLWKCCDRTCFCYSLHGKIYNQGMWCLYGICSYLLNWNWLLSIILIIWYSFSLCSKLDPANVSKYLLFLLIYFSDCHCVEFSYRSTIFWIICTGNFLPKNKFKGLFVSLEFWILYFIFIHIYYFMLN